MAVDDPVAALYQLPPDEFVAGRSTLVKQLKAAGEKEAAADVGRLKKPTVAAWALNQVRRLDPDALADFEASVARLRDVQDKAVGGDRTVDLRSAVADRREHAARVVQAAGRALREIGRDPDQQQAAIGATVEAAAADPSVEELLHDGRLTTDRSAPGFDPTAWAAPVGPRPDRDAPVARPRKGAPTSPALDAKRRRALAKEARQALAVADRQLKTAEKQAAAAEAEVAAAQKRVDGLENELRSARHELTELDRAAQTVRRDLDATRRRQQAAADAAADAAAGAGDEEGE